jgi:hypothetical protein
MKLHLGMLLINTQTGAQGTILSIRKDGMVRILDHKETYIMSENVVPLVYADCTEDPQMAEYIIERTGPAAMAGLI